MQLHNENIENSELNIHLNYSALPVLNVSNEVDQLTFEKNYIERNGEEAPSEGQDWTTYFFYLLEFWMVTSIYFSKEKKWRMKQSMQIHIVKKASWNIQKKSEVIFCQTFFLTEPQYRSF